MMSPKTCYHCGDICADIITTEEKSFCCNGCKQVYLLLSENNLCNYYQLDSNPGIKARGKFTGERFAYLEDESIINKLVLFKSDEQINVCFSLPQMHCSSCIFLLEKLHQIESGIILSRVNFQQKNIFISFNPTVISLRKVVELLSFIGYEPSITLQDSLKSANKKINKKQLIQIGVAGFCFSNIMMLSFPDYFSHGNIEQYALQKTFSWIILVLSLPVLFYSASSIFGSAFRGLRQKEINIDVPIALASLITFSRSYYEIISGTGAGYLDSGAGIIFFMLIGRWFQNKTYDSLSFDRQYQSYFPLGVTIKKNGIEQNIPITKLEVGDFIITRNNEMIPADAILVSDSANIDYSFVNGENTTSGKKVGDFLYAGGKQIGKSIVVKALKLPSQSYITELWNNSIFEKNKETKDSFIHPWSRYFTIVLFSIAFIASVFWYFHDTAKVLPVLTSVLIVACPCSLLLSSTFTFGNMLRLTGKHKLFLKNATVLETMAKINHIVFDKTGTITGQDQSVINYVGIPLTDVEMNLVKSITAHSSHVLSHSLYKYLSVTDELSEIESFSEVQGSGIVATSNGLKILLGNKKFTSATNVPTNTTGSSEVHITINDIYKGYFEVKHPYRKDIDTAIKELSKSYQLHILSGDNDSERKNIEQIFGTQTPLLFSVSPAEKLDYIKKLQQQKGATVLMIGDGLNDAGALMQSDVGIAVSENKANFSPACDGIIDGDALKKIPAFMKYARMGKRNVSIGFILSVLYNIAGISFAVQGLLSPVVAAILMPISSISIVTTAMLVSEWTGRFLRN